MGHNVLRVSLQYDVAKQVDRSNMLLGELCMHVSHKKRFVCLCFCCYFYLPTIKMFSKFS